MKDVFRMKARVSIDTDYTPGHSDGEPVREGSHRVHITLSGIIHPEEVELEKLISEGPWEDYYRNYFGE
jgi:hypothetical protein